MRLSLIAGVLLFTVLTFVAAIWSVPAGIDNQISANAANLNTANEAARNALVAEKTALVGKVAELEALNQELAAASSADVTAELEAAFASEKASLEAEITQLKTAAQELAAANDGAITAQAELRGEKDGLEARIAELETLNQAQADAMANASSVDVEAAQAAFAAEKSTLEAKISSLEALNEALAASDNGDAGQAALLEQLAGLEGEVVELETLNQELLAAGAAALDDGAAAREDRNLLDAELAQVQVQLEDATARGAALQDANAGLTAQIADLQAQLASVESAPVETANNVADVESELAVAEAALGEAETTIETLNEIIYGIGVEQKETQTALDALQVQADEYTARIAELESGATEAAETPDEQVAQLQAELDEKAGALAAAEQQLATLTEEATVQNQTVSVLMGRISDFEAEIATLQQAAPAEDGAIEAAADAVVEAVDATTEAAADAIAEVAADVTAEADAVAEVAADAVTDVDGIEQPAAEVAVAEPTLESCNENTAAIFANAKTNFRTGTTTIVAESIPALEALAEVVVQCAEVGLTLEIGGHTDSQGGENSNQALSEARAQSVQVFLAERGIPDEATVTVGYGESTPIADNNTAAGRAENRRITFEWQSQ